MKRLCLADSEVMSMQLRVAACCRAVAGTDKDWILRRMVSHQQEARKPTLCQPIAGICTQSWHGQAYCNGFPYAKLAGISIVVLLIPAQELRL